jgi:hypothetical protein
MKAPLTDYYDGDDDKGAVYRFPSLAVAIKYADEMTDDDFVIIDDRKDSDLLAAIQKVFR